MSLDPYGGDIFAGHRRSKPTQYPEVPAEPGMVVEVRGDDFVGAVFFQRYHIDGDHD